MADFNRKNKYNFWHSPLMLGALFLILVLFIYNIFGLFEKERETNKKKELILEEISTLNERSNILSSEIEKLKTEEGIEESIREKYQVAKPGEKVVIIVDEEEVKALEEINNENKAGGWFNNLFN